MPNRLIKESICYSDTIDKLTWFEEVVFERLIVNCDDYGRFDGRVAIIKSRLFPLKANLTEKTLMEAINKLATVGLVILYEYEDKPYLQLTTWEKHQQVRAKKSKYPAYDNTCKQMISDDNKCPRNPIQSNPNPNPNPIQSKEKTELELAIDDFVKMRKAIKKPLTERALNMLLKRLDELSSGVKAKERYKIECLNQSIIHNWQTVYPLNDFVDDREDTSDLDRMEEEYRAYLDENKDLPFSERLTMSEFYEKRVNGHA